MDLTDYIDSLGGAAGAILGGLNKKNSTPAPVAATPVASNSSITKFLPWIIGGVVGLVVLLVVIRK